MFTVIEGRQSKEFNHFELYDLEQILATDTRLMGVVAMKLTWRSKTDPKAFFYQVLHLDYSEYGVDDYFEFECLPENDDCELLRQDMEAKWNDFIAVMGGKIVELPPVVAVWLIDEAICIWTLSEMLERGDDNEHFRRGALRRIAIMKETLQKSGVITDVDIETLVEEECIAMVSPKKLHTFETINYFIMRMVDRDLDAATYLSTISRDELSKSELISSEIQTLIKNSIRISVDHLSTESESPYTYYCKFISMGCDCYYYGSIALVLTGSNMDRNRKVCSIDVGFHKRLSAFESAMLVKRTEYITVYDMEDRIMNYFDIAKIPMMASSTIKNVGNGWLFMKYNPDNNHLKRKDYYLNGDVFGAALMTVAGEFIVMSYQIMNINILETSIAASEYAPNMTLKGRYEVPNMAFQTMCDTPGLMFEEVIQRDDD